MDMSATGQTAPVPRVELVVAVASLGGLAAVSTVLGGLPEAFCIPLLLVQHGVRSNDPGRLSWLLQKSTTLPVRTARHGRWTGEPGITVIPGGFNAHLMEPIGCASLTAAPSAATPCSAVPPQLWAQP